MIDPVFADPCRFEECSQHGLCTAGGDGAPLCACEVGYAGETCRRCEKGFHTDSRGRCAPDRACAEQKLNPCGDYGRCKDDDGVIACDCEPGYEGPRCTLCKPGYGRNEFGDCVALGIGHLDAGHDDDDGGGPVGCEGSAIQGGVLDFEGKSTFPTYDNNCISRVDVNTDEVTITSLGGDGEVWACATNTVYGVRTSHIFVEAGVENPAELIFSGPISTLSFDYAARSELDLDVAGDGKVIQKLSALGRSRSSASHTFDPPITLFTLRSVNGSTQQVALDNIVYTPSSCP